MQYTYCFMEANEQLKYQLPNTLLNLSLHIGGRVCNHIQFLQKVHAFIFSISKFYYHHRSIEAKCFQFLFFLFFLFFFLSFKISGLCFLFLSKSHSVALSANTYAIPIICNGACTHQGENRPHCVVSFLCGIVSTWSTLRQAP